MTSARAIYPFSSSAPTLRGSVSGLTGEIQGRRLLWFTDTLDDMNGVSVTLKTIGRVAARRKDRAIRIATALEPLHSNEEIPEGTLKFFPLFSFRLPGYNKITLRIPEPFGALRMIRKYRPEEIYISTPGPVGLLGLFSARLLGIKSTGIFHTDFAHQALRIIGSPLLSRLMEKFLRWFFSGMDRLLVPSRAYIEILEKRGYDRTRMGLFHRGLDTTRFRPMRKEGRRILRELGIHPREASRRGVLLFAGRISKDKNIDLISDVYEEMASRNSRPPILIMAGEGPDQEEMAKRLSSFDGVCFTGRLSSDRLVPLYSVSDLFIFPSMTDTFGMAVLEAQACGLPALVSHVGGPVEIIRPDVTGFILDGEDRNEWKRMIETMLDLRLSDPRKYDGMRRRAMEWTVRRYSMNAALDYYVGISEN